MAVKFSDRKLKGARRVIGPAETVVVVAPFGIEYGDRCFSPPGTRQKGEDTEAVCLIGNPVALELPAELRRKLDTDQTHATGIFQATGPSGKHEVVVLDGFPPNNCEVSALDLPVGSRVVAFPVGTFANERKALLEALAREEAAAAGNGSGAGSTLVLVVLVLISLLDPIVWALGFRP